MKFSRRHFLTSVGTVCLALALFSNSVFAQMVPRYYGKTLGLEGYAARLDQWFYLYSPDATHQGNLQLAKVRDASSNARVEQFRITLRSELQALPMPSGYYLVATEPFAMYVKHTHEQDGRQYYLMESALLR